MSSRITITRGAGGVPVAVTALREQRAPSPADDQPNAGQDLGSGAGQDRAAVRDDNPFAPPPKGAPDQPWQPRHPVAKDGGEHPEGPDGQNGEAPGGERWSSRQPAPHDGGSPDRGPFGDGPLAGPGRQPGQGPGGPGGPQGQGPQGVGPRFDFTDPVQRRGRYSLLSGMWALFFGLFGLPQVALLLGALAMYWGISSLRGKAKPPAEKPAEGDRRDRLSAWQSPGAASAQQPTAAAGPARPAPSGSSPYGGGQHKPQLTAAVCGTIAASLALVIVVATFSFQIAYKGYYDCVNDALTQPARQSCSQLLPPVLRHSFAQD